MRALPGLMSASEPARWSDRPLSLGPGWKRPHRQRSAAERKRTVRIVLIGNFGGLMPSFGCAGSRSRGNDVAAALVAGGMRLLLRPASWAGAREDFGLGAGDLGEIKIVCTPTSGGRLKVLLQPLQPFIVTTAIADRDSRFCLGCDDYRRIYFRACPFYTPAKPELRLLAWEV